AESLLVPPGKQGEPAPGSGEIEQAVRGHRRTPLVSEEAVERVEPFRCDDRSRHGRRKERRPAAVRGRAGEAESAHGSLRGKSHMLIRPGAGGGSILAIEQPLARSGWRGGDYSDVVVAVSLRYATGGRAPVSEVESDIRTWQGSAERRWRGTFMRRNRWHDTSTVSSFPFRRRNSRPTAEWRRRPGESGATTVLWSTSRAWPTTSSGANGPRFRGASS